MINEKPCLIIEVKTKCKFYEDIGRVVAKKYVKFIDEDLNEYITIIPLKSKVFIPHYASFWFDEKENKYKINLTPTKNIRDKSKLIIYKYF